MPRIGAAHRHRDREAGRHQLWSPLRWPASTRLPSCAAAAHRPGPHDRRPSPAPRSCDGCLLALGPTPPRHPHRPITIARVLVPRLRSIRLLSRPAGHGWPMLRAARAGPHRTLIHSDRHLHRRRLRHPLGQLRADARQLARSARHPRDPGGPGQQHGDLGLGRTPGTGARYAGGLRHRAVRVPALEEPRHRGVVSVAAHPAAGGDGDPVLPRHAGARACSTRASH